MNGVIFLTIAISWLLIWVIGYYQGKAVGEITEKEKAERDLTAMNDRQREYEMARHVVL